MGRHNDSWGIEVGTNALKAVHLVRKGKEIKLADYELLPFRKVLTTPDLNVDEAIQVNLDQFMSRHNTHKSNVVISIPGHAAFARFAKLPPVEPKKIPDIVRFEAVQQIPFPIDQVEWDYQVFAQPDSPDVEVGIVAITKERVSQLLSNYRAVGLIPDGVSLSPMSVYNAFAYDLELTAESPGMILMDIGTTSTDVIIVEHGRLWLRTLAIGGNAFTEALMRSFKLSYPKAERLKREAGTSKYARQIFQAMRPVFSDLLQEMQRSLGYYQSLNRDANLTKIIGVGSTFRLPGLQKFLKQQLQMEVERLETFKRIKVEGKEEAEFVESTLNMATAYGLALQGLGIEQVSTNLLPIAITKQKLWREKRPWFGIAASIVFVASLGALGQLMVDKASFASGVADTNSLITSATNGANEKIAKWNSLQGSSDPRPMMENYRSMLDYRNVWPEFLIDLDSAAKVLSPQEPLLKNDYKEIRRIPWDDRRRLYIDSMSVDFKFAVDPEIATIDKANKEEEVKRKEEEAKKKAAQAKAPGAAPPPAPAAAPAGAPGQPPVMIPWGPRETSPVFIVTLSGMTPNKNGYALLKQRYIQWLRDHTERTGRPYRIWASGTTALVSTPMDETMFSGEARPSAGAAPAAARNPVQNQTANPQGVVFDPRKPIAAPPPTAAIEGVARPPLSDDMATRGWKFSITFRIQLVKPEDARMTEPPAEKPAETPKPGRPPASQPAPPAPRAASAR